MAPNTTNFTWKNISYSLVEVELVSCIWLLHLNTAYNVLLSCYYSTVLTLCTRAINAILYSISDTIKYMMALFGLLLETQNTDPQFKISSFLLSGGIERWLNDSMDSWILDPPVSSIIFISVHQLLFPPVTHSESSVSRQLHLHLLLCFSVSITGWCWMWGGKWGGRRRIMCPQLCNLQVPVILESVSLFHSLFGPF